MQTSFIKKIVSIQELEKISSDLKDFLKNTDENYSHCLGLDHDADLITKCFSNESLLTWNVHVWGHFNGEKWDGVFVGLIRKNEKFNKKMMDEYLWLSFSSNCGYKLYKAASEFAKKNGCEYISLNVVEGFSKSNKLKDFYKKIGFTKDYECFIKKI